MSIPVTCVCGKQMAAKEDLAGKRVRCSRCGSFLTVPAPPKAAPAPQAKDEGSPSLLQKRWFWPAIVGVVLLAGGGVWYFFFNQPEPPRRQASTKKKLKKAKPDTTTPKEEPGETPPEAKKWPEAKKRPLPTRLAKEPRRPRQLLPEKHIGELTSAAWPVPTGGGLALSPDGKLLLAQGALWDMASGDRLRQLVQGGESFSYWGFTKDGKHLCGIGQRGDNTFRLFNIENNLDVRSFRLYQGQGPVTWLTLSADGRRALVAHNHETAPEAHLWDVDQGQHLRTFTGHGPGAIHQAIFSPDERHVLTCGEDKTLRLWEVNTGKQVRRFDRHTGPVAAIAFSPDGKNILSGSHDGTLRLWNAQDGRELLRFDTPAPDPGRVLAVAFAADGKQALSGGADRLVRLWNVATGKEVQRFLGHVDAVRQVAFDPKGLIFSCGGDGAIRWWEAKSGLEVRRFGTQRGWLMRQPALFPDPRRRQETAFGRANGNPVNLNLVVEDPTPSVGGYLLLPGLFDSHVRLWDTTVRGIERRSFAAFRGKPWQMAITPDARLLYVSDAKSLRLVDLYTGEEIRRLTVSGADVQCVHLAPDGRHAVVGLVDGTLQLWDVDKAVMVRACQGQASGIEGVVISPLAGQCVSFGGAQDFSLRLWNLDSGQQGHRLDGHTNVITGVAYAPDGEQLVSVSRFDRSLRWWEVRSGKQLRCVFHEANDPDSGSCVAWSPDGKYLAVGGTQGVVRLLDAGAGKEMRRFLGLSGLVRGVAFSPDGRSVVAGGINGRIVVWDTDSGLERRRLDRSVDPVVGLDFSPEGKMLISGGESGKILLWELEPRELLTYKGHTSRVECLAFAADSRSLLTGGRDKTARLWELASGELLHKFEGHADTVWSVAFSPADHLIATGSADKTVRLWDEKTGQAIRTLNGHAAAVTALAFSTDGRFLLAGGADQVAILWDLKTYKEVDRLDASAEGIYLTEAASSDGQHVLSADLCNHALYWWDRKKPQEGPLWLRGHGGRVTSVALSFDKKYALSSSRDQTVRLWDLTEGKEVRQLEGHDDYVLAVSFSPDGRRALSAGVDKTVRLWDVATGKEVYKLDGHGERVTCVAFAADGRRAVSGSADKTVRVWNLDNGQLLHRLDGHTDTVLSVALAAEGNQVIAGGKDGQTLVWNARNGKQEHAIKGKHPAIIGVAITPDGQFALLRGADGAGRRHDLGNGKLVEIFPAPLPRLPSIGFLGEGKQLQQSRHSLNE